MQSEVRRIVIPRENAVFRLDRYGRWWNDCEKFTHKKIIDHFHRSIRRDADGFFLFQSHGNVEEKVYFPYEDTAYFIFDVSETEPVTLTMNTGSQILLVPEHLFLKEDILYVTVEGDPARFTDRAMMRLSPWIEEGGGGFIFVSGEVRVPIRTEPSGAKGAGA